MAEHFITYVKFPRGGKWHVRPWGDFKRVACGKLIPSGVTQRKSTRRNRLEVCQECNKQIENALGK